MTPLEDALAEITAFLDESAIPYMLIGGRPVQVASVEDLLLMKLASERPRDRDDAERLLKRYGGTLDRDYLMPLLDDLASALDRPEIARLADWSPRD